MEYIEKIFYSLLIYLIPGLFFIFGLLLAYLMWYRHSRRLSMLVIENRELQRDIKAVNTEDLRSRFHGKVVEKVQSVNDAWHHSHSTQEHHLKESLRQLEAQKIQLVTAKSELANKSQQLQEIDESFSIYKYNQEAIYNEVVNEKNALLASQGGSAQEAKIKALEEQLAASSSGQLGSISSVAKEPADYFANSQARNHYRYGYIFNDSNEAGYVDNLTGIIGISQELEVKLNKLGICQFKQIALWNQHQVGAFQHDLDFSGSIIVEDWVSQAAKLHNGKHGGVITPVTSLSSSENDPSTISEGIMLKSFTGEDVRFDDGLGVVFNTRPDAIDDLKLIRGVEADLEEKLNTMGIYRFRQIANWEIKQMSLVSNQLGFPGRVEEDDWKVQAKRFHLAKYGEVIG